MKLLKFKDGNAIVNIKILASVIFTSIFVVAFSVASFGVWYLFTYAFLIRGFSPQVTVPVPIMLTTLFWTWAMMYLNDNHKARWDF